METRARAVDPGGDWLSAPEFLAAVMVSAAGAWTVARLAAALVLGW